MQHSNIFSIFHLYITNCIQTLINTKYFIGTCVYINNLRLELPFKQVMHVLRSSAFQLYVYK